MAKIATITTKSLSSAFINFKKNQELKKIKEIKLKKLQENNELIKEKKELKIWEEKLKKEESTLSQNEQEEILKKIQTLYQSIQLLSQQIQAKEQEVTQKLQADQAESVQKVVNELIKAKKIKMLLNSQALLAFDRTDEKINLTPEVVDLINKEQKNK